jgi:hypothetical protein
MKAAFLRFADFFFEATAAVIIKRASYDFPLFINKGEVVTGTLSPFRNLSSEIVPEISRHTVPAGSSCYAGAGKPAKKSAPRFAYPLRFSNIRSCTEYADRLGIKAILS